MDVYISERRGYRQLVPEIYHCYNKLSNLVYEGKTNLFYKLVNNGECYNVNRLGMIYNVSFEYMDIHKLVSINKDNECVLFQIFMIGYILYRENISVVDSCNMIVDVYESNVPILMDIIFDNGYCVQMKTKYQVKLSTLNKLQLKASNPSIYYINKLRDQYSMVWSPTLCYVINRVHNINYIMILLFQFNIVSQYSKNVGGSHGGMISTREVNKNNYYRIGSVFEYRYSPIKVNRCISIDNCNKYNDDVMVYDFELNKIFVKPLDSLRLIDGFFMSNINSSVTQYL